MKIETANYASQYSEFAGTSPNYSGNALAPESAQPTNFIGLETWPTVE